MLSLLPAPDEATSDPHYPASTLYRSGDIESSGMGMKEIKDLCDAADVKVDYEKVPFGTKVTFHRNDPFAVLPQGNDEVQGAEARESTRKPLYEGSRSPKLHRGSGSASNKEAAHAVGLSTSGSLKLWRRLTERGLIESRGEGKSTSYVIASPFDD